MENNDHIGEAIFANIWGAQRIVVLTDWKHIKALGFRKADRAFTTLNDGRQALAFNGAKNFRCKGVDENGYAVYDYPNDGQDIWLMTVEKLEDIED